MFYSFFLKVFRELFESVIFEKHGLKSPPSQLHDFDSKKLKDAQLDPNYAQSIRIRTVRNISGYCLPSFCTRGERRDIESLVARALHQIDEIHHRGVYYSLKDLSREEEAFLVKVTYFRGIYLHRNFFKACKCYILYFE